MSSNDSNVNKKGRRVEDMSQLEETCITVDLDNFNYTCIVALGYVSHRRFRFVIFNVLMQRLGYFQWARPANRRMRKDLQR